MRRDAVVTAGPIWNQFMKNALADTPIEEFERPDGIRNVTVDAVSGLLPTQYTPETRSEVFADYNTPTKYDDVHVPVEVDSLTGLPATDSTPSDRRITEVYTVLHSERPNVASWEDPVIAWALANGYKYPPGSGIENPDSGTSDKVLFLSPSSNASITRLPFNVSIAIDGQVRKVDFLLDGTVVESVTTESNEVQVSINKNLSDGSHTLAARVTFTNGSTATNSIKIRYALDGDLSLSSPSSGDTVTKGENLVAESNKEFDSVNFYYSTGNSGSGTLIREAEKIKQGDTWLYTADWTNLPSSGNYRVFARSTSGETTARVQVEVE